MVLDKTGTLTEGKPAVTGWYWAGEGLKGEGGSHAEAIRAIESRSEHPLAQAIAAHGETGGKVQVDDFHSVTGSGVTGVVKGIHYVIGTPAFLESEGIKSDTGLS